jgi:formylglycine-generating enzyme required for sulfatase activity
VAEKKPNAFGLFDVHGNAWTWCHEDNEQARNPRNRIDDEDNRYVDGNHTRLLRGGSFLYEPPILRSAFSEHDRPSYPGLTVGFRLARTLKP